MEKVRAKFSCNSIVNHGHVKEAHLSAVYSEEGENADFAKATPSGQLSISIDIDTPASEFFQPQKEYYLEFTEVEE